MRTHPEIRTDSESAPHDLVIRGGAVVDGTGAEPRAADVAIDGDRITAVGRVDGRGHREVSAVGMLVTPGFIDAHTHLDAQVWWDRQLTPSTWHGVTTAVMGNCGVTFAPCRPTDHEYLARMMESVEDIPAPTIMAGIPWDWETYGDYLRRLRDQDLGLNVAGLVGHCALRWYAMEKQSLGGEAPSDEQLSSMRTLTREALDAGAIGFSASRTQLHMDPTGVPVPGTFAPHSELMAIASALSEYGSGILEFATRLHEEDGSTIDRTLAEVDFLGSLALETGRPVTFNLTQGKIGDLHNRILEIVHTWRDRGAKLYPQTSSRPISWLYGFVNRTPFDKIPSWRRLRGLTLDEKLLELQNASVRDELIHDAELMPPTMPLSTVYALSSDRVRYDLGYDDSLQAAADRRRVPPSQEFIERALATDGEQLYTWPIFNTDIAAVETMLTDESVIFGLADSGAHVGQIMDVGQPTYLLDYWTRERAIYTIGDVVRRLTSQLADLYGIKDRGEVKPGFFADLNIIDMDSLCLDTPTFVHDLPAGAGRYTQRANGYLLSVLNGVVSVESDERTDSASGHVL